MKVMIGSVRGDSGGDEKGEYDLDHGASLGLVRSKFLLILGLNLPTGREST